MEIQTSAAARDSSLPREIVANGGAVRGFVIPKASHYPRSEVDGIVDMAKLGATGPSGAADWTMVR
jgi:hypothetical protein